MIRFPHLLLGLALVAPFASAQPAGGPTKPDYPMDKQPLRAQWREPLASSRGHRNDSSVERLKFSDASKPGTLKVTLPWADVKIVGTDAAEVTVRSSVQKNGAAAADSEGFRRLDEDASFELREKGNTMTLSSAGDDHAWFGPGAEFTLEVPRRTNLVVRTQLGGDVSVSGVDGEIDVNGMNGDVSLDQVSGSAVVNTMNGEVRAVFATAPTKPVSITSMNGEIDVHLPADTKANLRLRTRNGSIRTNFPDGVLSTKTERVTGRVPGNSYAYAIGSAAADVERLAREAARMAREQADLARANRHATHAAPEAPATPADPEEPAEPADAAPVAPRAPMAGFAGGKSIIGTLNGGGVDISLSSMNGTLTLRQRK